MGGWALGLGVAAMCGVISILLTGCSTIVKGTQQQVSVATPGVQDAMCTLSSPAVGTRTADSGNDQSKHDVAVSCVKQCYTTGIGVLASETEIMTADNVVFVVLSALASNAASGAIKKYQPGVEIAMSPTRNCGAPLTGHGCPLASAPASPQQPPSQPTYIELPIPKMLG